MENIEMKNAGPLDLFGKSSTLLTLVALASAHSPQPALTRIGIPAPREFDWVPMPIDPPARAKQYYLRQHKR